MNIVKSIRVNGHRCISSQLTAMWWCSETGREALLNMHSQHTHHVRLSVACRTVPIQRVDYWFWMASCGRYDIGNIHHCRQLMWSGVWHHPRKYIHTVAASWQRLHQYSSSNSSSFSYIELSVNEVPQNACIIHTVWGATDTHMCTRYNITFSTVHIFRMFISKSNLINICVIEMYVPYQTLM